MDESKEYVTLTGTVTRSTFTNLSTEPVSIPCLLLTRACGRITLCFYAPLLLAVLHGIL